LPVWLSRPDFAIMYRETAKIGGTAPREAEHHAQRAVVDRGAGHRSRGGNQGIARPRTAMCLRRNRGAR
jgi:hypothetical protein